jgi:acyl carrier protein
VKIDTLLAPILKSKAPLRLEDSPDTIASWDSLAHIQLIVALEQTIDGELSTQEVMNLTSVARIIEICKARGVELTVD